MNFSEQFIKILDAMSNKVGIAVDWSSKAIMPHIQELAHKVVTYEIVTSCLWIGVALLIGLFCWKFTEWARKNDEYDEWLFVTMMCYCIIFFCIVFGIMELFDIATAIVLPEKTILEFGIDLKNSLSI